MMKKLLTPKQVAKAIQVSESSVKRWCDSGSISTEYTAGGHRRIPLASLLEFVRKTKRELMAPEFAEFSLSERATEIDNELIERLADSLLKGRAAVSCQIGLALYLAGHQISHICDGLIVPAFQKIGDQWECGEAQVYQERRTCGICHQMLHHIRPLIPHASADAPLAIGGTPAGDQYSIPTEMVELVLRENGWQANSLGCDLPFETLAAAIDEQQPKLFWLSVSAVVDSECLVQGYNDLYQADHAQRAFALGGQALTDELRAQLPCTVCCEDMQQLESFASQMLRQLAADPRQVELETAGGGAFFRCAGDNPGGLVGRKM